MGSFYNSDPPLLLLEELSRKFSISMLSFSSVGSASTSIIPFFLFLGSFVTPIRVRGETLRHTSSSSYDPFTPAKMHNLVMVAGWGISPLLLLR